MSTRLSDIPTEIFATVLYGQVNRLAFEDNIAQNASYSSGSKGNISTFIIHKHGDKTISDDHTLLEPLYGTMAYRGQVIQSESPRKTLRIKQISQLIYWKPVMQVEIAPENDNSDDRKDELVQLVQSWIDEGDTDEQRETLEHLIHALDEDRSSNRKLFPKELKGKSW